MIYQPLWVIQYLIIYIYIYIYRERERERESERERERAISKFSELATVIEGDPKAPFSVATTPRCKGGRYSFSSMAPLIVDPYLIMLSVKEEITKYDFLCVWYNTTWTESQFSGSLENTLPTRQMSRFVVGKCVNVWMRQRFTNSQGVIS